MAASDIQAEHVSSACDELFHESVRQTVVELLANASDAASVGQQLKEELVTMIILSEKVDANNQKVDLLRAAENIIEALAPAKAL
jgi:hypothetical protein